MRSIKSTIKNFPKLLYQASLKGMDTGDRITRYEAYQRLRKHRFNPSQNVQALSISGSQNLAGLLGFASQQIVDASYPEHNMLDLKFADNYFDLVVSDQVLEHLEGNPRQSLASDSWLGVI